MHLKGKLAAAVMAVVLAVGLVPALAFAAADAETPQQGLVAGSSDLGASEGETANLVAADDVEKFAYEGNAYKIAKSDGESTFGMLTPQGDTLKITRGNGLINISYEPSNKTVYKGVYFDANKDDSATWNDAKFIPLKEGENVSFTLDESYAGYAWPIAPVKRADNASTSSQYYMYIPSLNEIPENTAPAVYGEGQYVVGINSIKLNSIGALDTRGTKEQGYALGAATGEYTMFVPQIPGYDDMGVALVTVDGAGTATVSFYNNRKTYYAIFLELLDSATLGTTATNEHKSSASYIYKTGSNVNKPEFSFTLNTALLGKTMPYVTLNSSLKFNATQLAFVLDETMITKAAFDVKVLIAALPDASDVTIRNKDDIEAARDAYDALTEAQQAEVSNYAKLTAAEEALATVGVMDEATATVDGQITSLIQKTVDVNEETAAAVATARAGYDALPTAQKAFISDEKYQKLARAEACVQFVAGLGNPSICDGTVLDLGVNTDEGTFVGATISPRSVGDYLYLYADASTYTDSKKISGTVAKSTVSLVGDGTLLRSTWLLQTQEAQGREFTIQLTGTNGNSENVLVTVPYVYGTMAEGTYNVEATQNPSSSMRKFHRATINSDGTNMTATFVMPNTTYTKVFLGTKEAAAAAETGAIEPSGTESTGEDKTGNVYTIPIESMYQPITISYYYNGDWTAQETVEFIVDDQTKAAIQAVAALDLNTYFNVKATQKADVLAAQALYEALDDNQKALMANSNYGVLKKTYAMFTVADSVAAEIEALPAADAITAETVETYREAVSTTKAHFDGMGSSDIMKAALGKKADGSDNTLQNSNIEKLISDDLKNKLSACVAKVNGIDQAAVNPVATAIDALPEPANVTSEHYDAIKAARDAYNALSDAQKSLVENAAKLLADVELLPVPLTITNQTNMFKAVSASVETAYDGSKTLVVALSSDGYQWLYKGTYFDAVKANDAIKSGIAANAESDKLVKFTVNADDKYEFRIPISNGETFMPIVSISKSYYAKFLNGQNSQERSYYPRQMTIDLDNATLVTNDYNVASEIAVTSNVETVTVQPTATLTIVGGPNSNTFIPKLELTLGSDAYSEAFVGSAADAAESQDTIAATAGNKFTIPVMWLEKAGDPTSLVNLCEGVPFTLSLKSAADNTWSEFTVALSDSAKTLVFYKGAIESPAANNLVYNATEQTALVAGTGYSVSNEKATEAGEYTATATLEEGYVWADGTLDPKNVPFAIGKAIIPAPTAIEGLSYNGAAQTGVAGGDFYTVKNGSATNAGEYTATATADKNHAFTGNKETVDLKWSIAPANISKATVTLAKKSVVFNAKSQSVKVTGVKVGNLDLKSSDYGVTYKNNKNVGKATVTVTAKKNTNYTGSASAYFNITQAKPSIKTVTKKSFKASSLKKAKSFVAIKLTTDGKVSYKITKKDATKTLSFKSGKVTVKKNAAPGNYSIKVKVSAKAGKNYKKFAAKAYAIKVTVK